MRRAIVLTAIAVVASSALDHSVAAAAHAPELSPAARSLSRCVQANGRLSVVMLIDESGSLRETDPHKQRVDGIRAVLAGLANFSETSINGEKPEVSVLMAGFYGAVRPDPEEGPTTDEWRSVTRDDIDSLFDEAEKYADRDDGKATDYVIALEGARKMLAERAAEESESGGAAPCKALIWFTDGRYALPRRVGTAGIGLKREVPYAPGVRLDQRGAEAKAVAAGKRFMCQPNGLMDGLQGDEVILFTVALTTQLKAVDAAFLDAATTGTAGNVSCGSRLSPLTGEYLTAADGDKLLFTFAGVLSSTAPPTDHPICPQLECVRGETTFATVPGLSRFLILATAESESPKDPGGPLELLLHAPDGSSVTLRPDGPEELELAGTALTQRWASGRAVEVQGEFPADDSSWLGKWNYAVIDPAAPSSAALPNSFSSVQLFSDLAPQLDGNPVLIRGVPTKLSFHLASGSDANDAITTGPLAKSAHLTAGIDDPISNTSRQVPVEGPDHDGNYSATVTIPQSSTAGFVYLGLTANLTTPGGTPIAPQFRSFGIPVRFPPGQGFPTLEPATLHLPSLRGKGSVEGTLTVTGSSVSAGCVWTGDPTLDAPEGAGEVSVVVSPRTGSQDRCLPVGKNEVRKLTVRVTAPNEASGNLTISIPVHLSSEIVDEAREVSVPGSLVMAPPPNNVKKWVLFAFLVLVGTLLPLLLLHGLNVVAARFPSPDGLREISVRVEIPKGGRLRLDEGSETSIGRGRSLEDEGSQPVRKLRLDRLDFETVASGRWRDRTFQLFRGPYGLVTGRGERLLAGSRQPLRAWDDGRTQEVPLSLVGTWVFRLTGVRPAETPTSGVGSEMGAGPQEEADGEDFFSVKRPPTEPEAEQPVSRPQTAEGWLTLLISDGPPADQGQKLFAEAQQALEEADFWEDPAAAIDDRSAAEEGGTPDQPDDTPTEPIDNPPPKPDVPPRQDGGSGSGDEEFF